MQTNLRIKSISNADGKSTVTDNITYVNPNLSDANAKLLAMKINALTLNAYETTERIDTRDLSTDSKIDYNVDLKTTSMNASTGASEVVVISTDINSVNLNVNALPSNNTIVVSLRGLTPYTAPYYSELTVTSAEGTVINRAANYWTDDTPTTSARRTWTLDLILGGTFVAGDSFSYTIKVNEDSTHNPYTRTLTYRFVEWSGGEG